MLNAPGNDDEFAFFNPLMVVAEFHAEASFDDEKQFVFVLVMVEDEFSFELVELDLLAVEFGGNVGLPVFGDLGEFVGEIDFGHSFPPRSLKALDSAQLAAGAEVVSNRRCPETDERVEVCFGHGCENPPYC